MRVIAPGTDATISPVVQAKVTKVAIEGDGSSETKGEGEDSDWSNMLEILRGATVDEVAYAVRRLIANIVRIEKRMEDLESRDRHDVTEMTKTDDERDRIEMQRKPRESNNE
jgi:hypothetical protein